MSSPALALLIGSALVLLAVLLFRTVGRLFHPRCARDEAGAVYAQPVAEGAAERLSVLVPGERAVVVSISRVCDGAQRRRLLDLGLVPGTVVEAEMAAPSGDPVAYRIRGATIALRRDQADRVCVERHAEQIAS